MQLSAALLLALGVAVGPRAATAQGLSVSCTYDLNGDGLVGTDDLLLLLGAFGREVSDPFFFQRADGSGDGVVSTQDLLGLLAVFGRPCASDAPPPPVSTEDAAAQFAAALAGAAADPATPLLGIASELALEGDIADVEVGTAMRAEFEAAFSVAIASLLGDGNTVLPEHVVVDGIRGGSLIVSFHILVPESLSSTCAALVESSISSGAEVVVSTSSTSFIGSTASMLSPYVIASVVDCIGTWVPDGDCSEPCGPNGVGTSTMVVTRTAQNGGVECAATPGSSSNQACNTHIQCPIDCTGEWDEWSTCSVPCGGGNQTHAYVVLTEAQHGGACPNADMVETRDCNTAACAPPPELVNCNGYWDVGECSHMCAPGGTRQRVFVVNNSEANGGAPCSSTAGAVEVEPCNEDSQCPVDCIGVWRDWAPCSLSCGGGEQTRSFEISSPASNGGACPEEDVVQTQSCNTQPCPVDCTGAWEDWSSCSRTCGGGTQTRGYLVLEAAQLGGICTHAGATQTQDCNLQMCSVLEPADSLQLADGLIIEPDHLYTLPLSTPGSLVTISRVASDGAAYTVGRSYDGFPWEGVMPNPLSFDCDGGTAVCETYPASQSAGDAYRFSLISNTDERDTEAVLAEFLMQTTFGQTRSSIAEIVAIGTDADSSINNWMNAQMSMPASLHRAHWRRNTNPPQAVANIAGGPSHPCATDALWHRFAFSLTDQGKLLEIRQVPGTAQYSLFVNGVRRTEVSEDFVNANFNQGNVAPPYTICDVVQRDGVGGRVVIGNSTTCVYNQRNNVQPGFINWQLGVWSPLVLPNPPIQFSAAPAQSMSLSADEITLVDGADRDVKVTQSININCPLTAIGPSDYSFLRHSGDYYRHEPVTKLLENTLENPAVDPPVSFPAFPRERKNNGNTCPSAPKTFLNRNSCVRRPNCRRPLEYTNTSFVLDEAVILAMYSSSANRHVHAIDNLPFAPGQRSGYNPFDPELSQREQISGSRMNSPCSVSSRWRKVTSGACVEETALDEGTKVSIRRAVSESPDQNPSLKDIATISGTCSGDDVIEASVTVAGDCWQHTHPSNLNVYDFTAFTVQNNAHVSDIDFPYDGAFEQNPIAKAAWDNQTILRYNDGLSWRDYDQSLKEQGTSVLLMWPGLDLQSSSHAPGRADQVDPIPGSSILLGRLGDTLSFPDLPVEFQTEDLAELIGATVVGGGEWDGSEACGSPGEVANEAINGHNYGIYSVITYGNKDSSGFYHEYGQRSSIRGGMCNTANQVMTNVAVAAPDQLRQRVAWGLSQLYLLSGIGFAGSRMNDAEHWITYHDIFVRHAFGNLRDILREVAYSPMQGMYLTFINSASFQASGKHPDENFAREFMELFSIGTELRNVDGTLQTDASGDPIATYSNKDVMNYARAWTGFQFPQPRTNVEGRMPQGKENLKDPMILQPRWRDPFPKTNLVGGYIGDGTPLCSDLPPRMFLRKGATYVYRGWTQVCATPYTPSPMMGRGGCGDTTARFPRGHFGGPFEAMDLSSESPLYLTLCAADEAGGTCTFPSEVKLTENLGCHSEECDIQTLKQVKITTATETVYYEYEPAPCVDLEFYNDGKTLKIDGGRTLCADPRTASASPSCCNDAAVTNQPSMGLCNLERERVTFQEAQERCSGTPDVPLRVDRYDPLPPADMQSSYHMAVDPAGDPTSSQCLLDTTPLEVRCCSDTQVGAFTAPQGMTDANLAANVALGRPCTQSSVQSGGVCERAFDGNDNPDFSLGSVTHTRRVGGEDSWIQVDLGSTIHIQEVRITHRNAGTGRGNGAVVTISDTPDYTTGVQCGGPLSFSSGNNFLDTVSCPGAAGRYVTMSKGPRQFIHIAEMEVEATVTETCSSAFPDGMPFSLASFNNNVTQANQVPNAPAYTFIEGPCGAGYEPILDLPTCQNAVDFLEIGSADANWAWNGGRDNPTDPGGAWIEGCSHRGTTILFHQVGSTDTTGWGNAWGENLRSICKLSPMVVDGCIRARTQDFAEAVCAAEGARLCSPAEVLAECVTQTPCAERQGLMWTSEECSPPPNTMAVCSGFTNVAPAAEPETSCGTLDWFWLDQPCTLFVNVDRSGALNTVQNTGGLVAEILTLDHDKSHGTHAVHWTDGLFPDPASDCSNSLDCQVHSLAGHDDTCLCAVTVAENAVFTEVASLTRTDVLARLKIGAASPDTFDDGVYSLCVTAECIDLEDLEVWLDSASDASMLTMDAIISTVVRGETRYFKNAESIAGFSGFSFRNPPQFLKFEGSTLDTDTFYETEAVIDSLFYHDNVAPYISHALIQRFVTSNPSPRYTQTVAQAFSTGTYDGRTYSGKYGDMGAAVAAMLLDREARSATIKADSTHGMVRETYASVIHVLRAMEYSSDYVLELIDLHDKIGMQPYAAETVFSYYEPDFTPDGKVGEAGLVSPEASLATSPLTIAMMNGLHGLVDLGLTYCFGGFAGRNYDHLNGGTIRGCNNLEQTRSLAKGHLMLPPPDVRTAQTIVDQLDMLLTGSRLDQFVKDAIVEEVHRKYYSDMHIAAHGRGLIDPITGEAGQSSYCALGSETFSAPCCSDTADSHGDYAYFSPHSRNSATCAAVTDNLWIGTYVLEGCGTCTDNACRSECCLPAQDYSAANAACAADGARLCTAQEVEAGCVGSRGCGFERARNPYVWTGTPCSVDNTEAAQSLAAKLIFGTSEFRTFGVANRLMSDPRTPFPTVESQQRPYKAVVMIFMNGGADTYNMIVPHSECGDTTDLYAQYQAARGVGEGGVALLPNQLIPIDVPAGTQPCNRFGLHYKFENIKQMYEGGEVAFIANMGSLIEPLTKEEYQAKTKRIPRQLFGHANGRKQSQMINAEKGILGRMVDALRSQSTPLKAAVYSMYNNPFAVSGRTPPNYVSYSRGIEEFVHYDDISYVWQNITAQESSSIMTDTWAAQLGSALTNAKSLAEVYASGTTTESFDIYCPSVPDVRCHLHRQLQAVAKMTSVRSQTENEREVFFVSLGGFDLHQDLGTTFAYQLSIVDQSVAAFKREMVHQGIWDNVVVVTASDFGRTLSSNGLGTDHAWGGNYFVTGGSVNGGQILGHYPSDLTDQGPNSLGRGRMIPTLPYDAMWYAAAQWMDVEASKMSDVVPNHVNFEPGSTLITREQMFTN